LLGRAPRGAFVVVVRDPAGDPVVIRNDPLLDDGTPMPTRYWLVGREARLAVDRLEAAGGVRAAEAAVDPAQLRTAHTAYAAERDASLPSGWAGPGPSGGVGGTRRGVKCLHAHYAWYLAGGDDPVGRWVAAQLTPAAAIDCGTNSTRLLIAHPRGATVERLNRITRLGAGVDRTGRLEADAIARTVAVLEEYRRAMDRHGVVHVRMTATSAARDAENREDFFAAAESVIGIRPELLSGEQEGRFSFQGAVSELDPRSGPWLVVDIGGGSTEMVAGSDPDGRAALAVRSIDVGCVRLTERFLTSDPPAVEEVNAARQYVSALVTSAVKEVPGLAAGHSLVGLAGSVATLAAIDQRVDEYDRDRVHHYVLSLERVERMLADLAALTSAQRRLVPGVEPARADVIVGGTIVLDETMRCLGFAECLTSEADILDGLVLSLSGSPGPDA
jgi:exopolyphosphatase / guanosine-5'-triphosphate,3'-diphosphate pyrophosphatase